MTNIQSVQSHPASVDAYIRHGWSLVPIPAGTKGPRIPAWNLKENALRSQTDLPAGHGIGLAHAFSGTMALDIDNWNLTIKHGIDLAALYAAPDAVIVDSSRPGHGKLLYAMPFALPSKKIIINGVVAFELRCATASGLTVQDVLPPSIHPDTGQPYRWAGSGHWTRLPLIPESLLTMWQSMLADDSSRSIATEGPIGASWEEIRSAVDAIPPTCVRDEWISVGMALHYAGTQTNQLEQAFYLWDQWSQGAPDKYPGPHSMAVQWSSFKPDKANAVKLGTLYWIAKENGWVRPPVDVSTLFAALPTLPPASVIEDFRAPAPDIDLSIFPKVLSQRAQEVSDSVGCDPLIPLFAGLGAVCAVVDARIRLELMPGFKVPPILWLMTIGAPADKKSPGSRPMLSVLKSIELEDRTRYQQELLDWEGQEAAHAAAKRAFLEFAASPEAILGGSQPPIVPNLPAAPVPLRFTVSDITSQKLVRSAAERPRGLLCYLDEMSAWGKKLTDKHSGEDRSAWVVSYESEFYEMDRVGAGSIYCENLAVSIFGNIQPRVFADLLPNMSADGLLQRFIPVVLRGEHTKLGNPMPEWAGSNAQWESMLRTVYALPEQTYTMSDDAYSEYRVFQAWYEDRKHDERLLLSNDTFMTAFGKLEGTTGRLILLWHIMEHPYQSQVGVDTVRRVVQFVRGFVIGSLRYAFGEIGNTASFAKWLADHVIQYCDKGLTVTLADIRRSGRRQFEGAPQHVQEYTVLSAMHDLEQAGWVIRLDDGTREHQHHAEWALNAELKTRFADYRRRVVQARQRQREERGFKNKPPVWGSDD
jgi:hypothetical protein